MKNQKTLIVLVASLVLVFAVSGFVIIRSRHPEPTPPEVTNRPYTTPVPGGVYIPPSDKIVVDDVDINNIFRDGEKVSDLGYVTITEDPDFAFDFFPERNNYFLITITGSPFEETRRQAEKVFLDKLGISENDACKLNVEVSTPLFANPNESGALYKLSFCN